jgi:hypothetical protein
MEAIRNAVGGIADVLGTAAAAAAAMGALAASGKQGISAASFANDVPCAVGGLRPTFAAACAVADAAAADAVEHVWITSALESQQSESFEERSIQRCCSCWFGFGSISLT